MKKSIVFNFMLASMMLVALTSCHKKPYLDITYELECTGDLLEYATPKVTHTDNNKQAVNIELSKSDFEYNETTQKYVWKYEVPCYEDFSSVDDEMRVTYEVKLGVSIDKESVDLTHLLYISYEMRDDDENIRRNKISLSTNVNVYVNGNRLNDEISNMSDYRKGHFESNGTAKFE